jgi:tryptophan synthase
MEGVKFAFKKCKEENRAALVTYVTAGYPTARGTPEIMLALQAGGAGKKNNFVIVRVVSNDC